MTRSVRLLAGWGLHRLGLARIEILTHPENHRSVAVAERAGFRREGLLRGYRENGGERQRLIIW
jgi:RimJ/RimL family protein N-acetyltransferase